MGIYNIPIGATGGYGHGPASTHSNTATGGIGNTGKAIGNGLGLDSGLGMYPGTPTQEPCYDPNRPSWLPYWLDTFSEEECWLERSLGKNTVLNFGQPTTGPAPASFTDMLAYPNSTGLDTSAANAQVTAWQDWYPTAIPDTATPPSSLNTLLAVAVVVGLIYMFMHRR